MHLVCVYTVVFLVTTIGYSVVDPRAIGVSMYFQQDYNEDERQLIEINRAIRNDTVLTRHCRPMPLSDHELKGVDFGCASIGVAYANTSDMNMMIKDSSGMPIVVAAKNVDQQFTMFPRKPWMRPDMLYIIKFNRFDASRLIKEYKDQKEAIADDAIKAYTSLYNGVSYGDSPHHDGLASGLRRSITDNYREIYDEITTPVTGATVVEIPISKLSLNNSTYIQSSDVVVAVLQYHDVHDGLYSELKYRGDFIHPSTSALTATQMHLLKSPKQDSSYFREVKVFDNKLLYKESYVFVADYSGITTLRVHYDKNVTGPTIVVTQKNKESGQIETSHVSLDNGATVGVFMTMEDARAHCPAFIKSVHEKIKTAEKMMSEADHQSKINEIKEKMNAAERRDINNKKTEVSDKYERIRTVTHLASAVAAVLAAATAFLRVILSTSTRNSYVPQSA